MNYSLPQMLELLVEGGGLVLATVVEAEGSTPQVPGSWAIFSKAGLVAGTVGGGILEGSVEIVARKALGDGKARIVDARLDADPSDLEGAICGGAVKVLVDPGVAEDRAVFRRAFESNRKNRPGCLYTGIRAIAKDLVSVKRYWQGSGEPMIALAADPDASEFPGEMKDEDRTLKGPRLIQGKAGWTFIEYIEPLPRLIIAGAGHVGRAVARIGRLLDFSVTVIDDRAEFANKENIPDADEIVVGPIGESVAELEDVADSYFVIVTRGHQRDAEALRAALGKPSAYVGMIGSKPKVETMRRAFLGKAWTTAEEWAAVHSPIGLDIGSKTVEEIAVSIAAELVLVRSKRKEASRGQP